MRIGCSCGAWIKARRSDALAWETRHTCPDRTQADDGVHVGTGAQVEHAGQWEGDRVQLGFQRETR